VIEIVPKSKSLAKTYFVTESEEWAASGVLPEDETIEASFKVPHVLALQAYSSGRSKIRTKWFTFTSDLSSFCERKLTRAQ